MGVGSEKKKWCLMISAGDIIILSLLGIPLKIPLSQLIKDNSKRKFLSTLKRYNSY